MTAPFSRPCTDAPPLTETFTTLLPRLYCPDFIAQTLLPRLYCPDFIAQTLLPRLYCPDFIAQTLLPRLYCPDFIAQTLLPRLYCPDFIAQTLLPRLYCPDFIAQTLLPSPDFIAQTLLPRLKIFRFFYLSHLQANILLQEGDKTRHKLSLYILHSFVWYLTKYEKNTKIKDMDDSRAIFLLSD